MIGDDAVARAVGRIAGQRLRSRDQRPESVGIVIVVDALQHGGDPFQPHAGVDRRARQRRARAARRLVELHEDEVPDLDETVAILVRAARRAAGNMIAMVKEDFGAWSARARIPHRPEIVVGRDADDAAFGKPRDPAPQVERLVVAVIDRHRQAVGVDAPFARDEVPGEPYRPFLEVIAEREIAQHFEEGMVPRRIAHIVEIVVLAASPHAFLRRRGGDVRTRLQPREDILERHHAGVDEHERRVVVRHQRCRRHARMPLGFEIIEERAADVVRGCHGEGDLG